MNKRVITLVVTLFFLVAGTEAPAQLGGLMNKVKNKIVEKALGVEQEGTEGQGSTSGGESNCASEEDQVIFEFGKGFKVAANEITVHIHEGRILLFNKAEGKYYIKRGSSGATEGPFKGDDPAVEEFGSLVPGGAMGEEELLAAYPRHVTRTGDNFTIRFGGQTYGPFAGIHSFVVNENGTQFAALVVKDAYRDEGGMAELARKMENAKTDQEKMAIAMANQEKMAEEAMKIASMDMTPKLITNVPGALTEVPMGGELFSTIKKNTIVWVLPNAITDLAGKKLFEKANLTSLYDLYNFWLSGDNKTYAWYDNGLLQFSDGRECSGVFSPFREPDGTGEILGYFYFSPKRNAILKSSHPF
ncbi:MAG TPA: hypothetical protein PLX49_08415 [Prolixibacteraceae bacterium]|nr:hypothetical protein [Prolixibacteraceae bacterium]